MRNPNCSRNLASYGSIRTKVNQISLQLDQGSLRERRDFNEKNMSKGFYKSDEPKTWEKKKFASAKDKHKTSGSPRRSPIQGSKREIATQIELLRERIESIAENGFDKPQIREFAKRI